MTLYQIDDELAALSQSIDDAEGEVDDETSDRFDALHDARADKGDAYIALIKNAEAAAYAIDAERARLSAHLHRTNQIAERLKGRLLASMERSGQSEIVGRLGKVRRQRSASKRVEVLVEVESLPERFQRVRVEADKTALKDALAVQDPEAVQLAEVVETESYHVRIL